MKSLVSVLVAACGLAVCAATLENAALRLRFDERTAAFDVVDRRTGRVWSQMPEEGASLAVRAVQVANGCRVTVNFGDRPYEMKDGSVLPSQGVRFSR